MRRICPAYVPDMSRICPALLMGRDISGAYTEQIGNNLIFRCSSPFSWNWFDVKLSNGVPLENHAKGLA